jgi:hypothetical protein
MSYLKLLNQKYMILFPLHQNGLSKEGRPFGDTDHVIRSHPKVFLFSKNPESTNEYIF